MNKKFVFMVFTLVFLLLAMVGAQFLMPSAADPVVIRVPEDYSTIQEAINAASSGDVIQVAVGTYYEHLTINKSLMLTGEDRSSTIIDGNGTGTLIRITASNISISGFTVQNSGNSWWDSGIFIGPGSSGNTISGNIITSNFWSGIVLENASGNTIIDNQFSNNGHGLPLGGGDGIELRGSSSNTIRSNVMINNVVGVLLGWSSNNIIVGNTMSNNHTDIDLIDSEGNVISNNTMTSYKGQSVALYGSSGNVISNNTILISKDPVFGGGEGVRLMSSGPGMGSNGNVFVGNTIRGGEHGIFSAESSNNTFIGNTIRGCGVGFGLDWTRGCILYYNNFVNNAEHVHNYSWDSPWVPYSMNAWDNGVEGNYWSDYKGVDLNGDGIGDTPYIIDENNTDHYPLMGMFSDFPVTLGEENYHVTTVSNSTVSAFYFDQSTITIGFNVTGSEGTMGFCRVMFPRALLGEGPYNVTVDGLPPLTLKELPISNSTHAFLYFTYVHSTHEVKIFPEFPPALIPLLLIITALLATILKKMTHSTKKPASSRQ